MSGNDPSLEGRIRVSLYGAGQVNGNVARVLDKRPGITVLGPFGRADRERALRSRADVVVIATTSFLVDVAADIRDAVSAGANVLTTAEEAAFPEATNPSLAAELNALAEARGVTILGTGLNPGYAFDALVLTATGVAWAVESLFIERVVRLSGFGATVLRRIGIGYTREEFDAGIATGAITGHLGFPQSMRVVANQLGVQLGRIERAIKPTFAERPYEVAHLTIPAGVTAGFEQRYTGMVNNCPWFEAVFIGHLDPHSQGTPPRDEIVVRGPTPVRFVVEPGFDSQLGASAVVANSVPRVIAASPGWRTVAELPPASPW